MTTATLITVALIIGIAAGGLWCVFLFRRQVLSIGLLTSESTGDKHGVRLLLKRQLGDRQR